MIQYRRKINTLKTNIILRFFSFKYEVLAFSDPLNRKYCKKENKNITKKGKNNKANIYNMTQATDQGV